MNDFKLTDDQRAETPAETPVEIPLEQLSEDLLAGIIENFILREGTDYGLTEVPYEKKVEQIRRRMNAGQIKVVFDLTSDSVTLLENK